MNASILPKPLRSQLENTIKAAREVAEQAARAAPAVGGATRQLCPPLPGPRRSHGSGLRDRRLHDAGDRRVLPRALLDGEPRRATIPGVTKYPHAGKLNIAGVHECKT
jgi:hypothetical protein